LPEHGRVLCLVLLERRGHGKSHHVMRHARNHWYFENGDLLSQQQRVVCWAAIADPQPETAAVPAASGEQAIPSR
jgi:hypothetical protein